MANNMWARLDSCSITGSMAIVVTSRIGALKIPLWQKTSLAMDTL